MKQVFYSTRDGLILTPHYINGEDQVGYIASISASGSKCLIISTKGEWPEDTLNVTWGSTGEITETFVEQNGSNVTNQLKSVLGMDNLPFSPVPIVTSLTTWNAASFLGDTTPTITLPAPEGPSKGFTEEIQITWIAATANASFIAPAGWVLGDSDGYAGLNTGNTLAYTNLTAGSLYEVSIAVVDEDHLSLVMVERPGVYDD